jgi:hypothetical protein
MANKIFYSILILLILGSVGFTFWRIVIQKDYQIVAEVSCDPAAESCFHYDGVVCDGKDPECVPEEAYDYKMISKKAASIYACEQTEEKVDCTEELSCLEGEENCEYTNCDPAELGEDESCATIVPEAPSISTSVEEEWHSDDEAVADESTATTTEATTTDEVTE